MNLEEFRASASSEMPPENISDYLKALWYDMKGDWQQSHHTVQDIETPTASWIHAYLHRKEGDIGNADYWYSRAGRKRPSYSLEKEWEDITSHELSPQ